MTETTASLQRKIGSASDLRSVVRTMKALATANIGQYERAVNALADYYRTVELGLGACFREPSLAAAMVPRRGAGEVRRIGAVVFGSDQGLVGRFNDIVTEDVLAALAALPVRARLWAVGERVHARLTDSGLDVRGLFLVPSSVHGINALVGQILVATEQDEAQGEVELHLFYNRPTEGSAYAPVRQRLLPLDELWHRELVQRPWPTRQLPEVMGSGIATLRALIREYLFISLFRACAESLASENASRLAAMERADQNIGDLLTNLRDSFHRLRQGGMDEELFDVIAGFEALRLDRLRA